MIIPDVRSAWRRRWLESIQEIADFDIQKQTWLNPDNSNPHFSYVEYVASYFDDLVLASADSYPERVREGLLNQEETLVVADFHARFDVYVESGRWDPQAVLNVPAWLAVVAAARLAQARLLALLDDDSEKAALTARSPHAIFAAS